MLVEQTAVVPVAHLRLLVTSIRQVRTICEQLAVQIPVLNAAETALVQHCSN